MSKHELEKQLVELQEKIHQIESQLTSTQPQYQWNKNEYYWAYHVIAGLILGFFGAATSLLFNVVGSILIGQHPLELVRIYLTFPLGESALNIQTGATLALGCCLYLATGAFYGMFIHIVLSRIFDTQTRMVRFVVASVMGVALWIVNYYAILSWLQPTLFGGSWIVNQVPFWVALATHLVFAWTVYVIDGWGRFDAKSYMA